jgi:hypothetical protein
MTSIMSSPGGSAVYPTSLSQLLSDSDGDTDVSGTDVPQTAARTMPSLASVLSTDDTTGVGAQATSTINSLMMEIQALKAKTSSDPASSTTTTTAGTQAADPQQGAVHGHHRHHGGGEAADAAKAFAEIDTDKNGSVSLAEFVAGRPDSMSQEDATAIFKSFDPKGTGSVNEDQFAAELKAEHETAGAGHAAGVGDAQSEPDIRSLAQDLMTQLKEVIQTFNNGYVDGGDGSAPADTTAIG